MLWVVLRHYQHVLLLAFPTNTRAFNRRAGAAVLRLIPDNDLHVVLRQVEFPDAAELSVNCQEVGRSRAHLVQDVETSAEILNSVRLSELPLTDAIFRQSTRVIRKSLRLQRQDV